MIKSDKVENSSNQLIVVSRDANGRTYALPKGWTWTNIGEVTDLVNTTTPKDDPESKFIYLDISSIDNEINRVVEPKHYMGSEAPSRARQVVHTDDILFSTVRTYLKNIAMVPEKYDGQIASTGFCILRANPATLGTYLFYYVLTDDFLEELGKLQRGVSYPAVRDGDVFDQPIPLAPLPEQRRIVDAIETQFTRLDAAVEALQRAQANLKRYRASVLKAACEGRLVPTEAELAAQEKRDYESASLLLDRILVERRARWEEQEWQKQIERAQKKAAQAQRKAAGKPSRIRDLQPEEWQSLPEEAYARYLPKNDKWKEKYPEPAPPDTDGLPDLPEGWCWATLEQLASGKPRSIQSGPFGSSLLHSEFQSEGVLAIGIDNVLDGEFSLGRQHRISAEKYQELEKYTARPLDVLITVMATVGRTCVIPPDLERAIITKHVYRVGVEPLLMSPYYLMQCLAGASAVLMQINENIQGQTRPGINGAILKQLAIPMPPTVEQHRIVSEIDYAISVANESNSIVETNMIRAERLRQSILKRAFEGKLVPQDPNDEPASLLLQRIEAERNGEGPPAQLSLIAAED